MFLSTAPVVPDLTTGVLDLRVKVQFRQRNLSSPLKDKNSDVGDKDEAEANTDVRHHL